MLRSPTFRVEFAIAFRNRENLFLRFAAATWRCQGRRMWSRYEHPHRCRHCDSNSPASRASVTSSLLSQMTGASSRMSKDIPRLTELETVQAELEYALQMVQMEIRDAGGTPKPKSRASGAFTSRSRLSTAAPSSRPSTGALGGGNHVPKPPSTGRRSSVPSRNTPLQSVPRVSQMKSIEEEAATWESALQRRSVTARARCETHTAVGSTLPTLALTRPLRPKGRTSRRP